MNSFLFNPKTPNEIAKELVEKIKQHRKELVEKIKQHRKKLKISQAQLASKSGVSLGSIKRFESKYEISLNSFIKILIALNLEQDLENLFTQKDYNSIDEVING